MFLGRFEHTIDDKGRLAIPRKYRDQFSAGLVLTESFDRCLWAFTLRGWDANTEAYADLDTLSADARAVNRIIYGSAWECQLDQQGRVVIPGYLRQYAHLENEVILVGVRDRLEIWNKDEWERQREMLQAEGSQMVERLSLTRQRGQR